jgi:DNA-binding FrmR family transcriptional regulator
MSDEYRQQILSRLRSLEGHMRGVMRMVEDDAYCIDVIHQNLAILRAIEKVNRLILEHHLETCVTTAIRGDDPAERERVIGEIVGLFEASGRM